MRVFQKTREVFLDVLFPPLCLKCRKYLESEKEKADLLCSVCFGSILVYTAVSYGPKFTLAAVSSYENGAVRELLHYFKYERFLGAEMLLRELVMQYLDKVSLSELVPDDAVIVPVPLHKKRLRQRGFNQSEIIADILGKQLKIPVKTEMLVRIKDTPQQITLKNKDERRESVCGSFKIRGKENVKGKTVILADDVYTSGATMTEAAKILRRAGAKDIIGFVIAKAE